MDPKPPSLKILSGSMAMGSSPPQGMEAGMLDGGDVSLVLASSGKPTLCWR